MYTAVLHVWGMASMLVDTGGSLSIASRSRKNRAANTPSTSSSSSSRSSAGTTTTSSSNSRNRSSSSGTTTSSSAATSSGGWALVPALAHVLPAVAGVAHRYLQLPPGERLTPLYDTLIFMTMIQQLQGLVQDAAAAERDRARGATSGSGSSSTAAHTPQQQHQQHQLHTGHSQRSAALVAGQEQLSRLLECLPQDERLLHPAARAQVRWRMLWQSSDSPLVVDSHLDVCVALQSGLHIDTGCTMPSVSFLQAAGVASMGLSISPLHPKWL
jgi:hypothetical protein